MLPVIHALIPDHHSMNTSDIQVDHGGIEESRPSRNLESAEAQRLILALGLTTDLARAVVPILIRNLITLEAKQKDYGPHNLTKFGTFGVVVRMGDKMERIINLANKSRRYEGVADAIGRHPSARAEIVQNEPLADSFLDMANYSLIGYVMNTNTWPK